MARVSVPPIKDEGLAARNARRAHHCSCHANTCAGKMPRVPGRRRHVRAPTHNLLRGTFSPQLNRSTRGSRNVRPSSVNVVLARFRAPQENLNDGNVMCILMSFYMSMHLLARALMHMPTSTCVIIHQC